MTIPMNRIACLLAFAFLKGDSMARSFLDSRSVEELSEGEARLTKAE